jgi:hypothetical protein
MRFFILFFLVVALITAQENYSYVVDTGGVPADIEVEYRQDGYNYNSRWIRTDYWESDVYVNSDPYLEYEITADRKTRIWIYIYKNGEIYRREYVYAKTAKGKLR